MKKSTLIQIFNTFFRKDVRDFRKWLQSPIHNQREDVIKLYNLIINEPNQDLLIKENLFHQIFPDRDYDDAYMRQILYFLLKAVEEYLIWNENNKNEIKQKLLLAKAFRERKLDKAFQKTIDEVERLQEDSAFRNETHLHHDYLLQQEKYIFLEGKKRTIPTNLQAVSDVSDIVFCAQKLKQATLVLAHQSVYKSDYSIGMLDYTLAYVQEKGLLRYPAISIYYYCYKMITDKTNEENYFQLSSMLEIDLPLFPMQEQKDIFILAINFCIGKINAGVNSFFREVFQLYQLGLAKGVFIENGIISRFTFKNIVSTGVKLREFDWTASFIDEYKNNVEEMYRESTINFSMSKLYYEKKDYAKAMQLLEKTDFDDFLMNMSGQTMMIKMLYEQNQFDELDALLERFRSYLNRKDIMGYHKNNYKNLLKYTKKMLNLNPYKNEQRIKLIEEIKAASPLTEKDWILGQLQKKA